ncbi:T9SS type A sorting domain-containing protein [Pseudarcicella hirudinis]
MAGRDTMDVATLSGGTGTFNVVVTETPVFVIPSGSVSSSSATEPESGLGVFSTHSNPVIVTASVGTPDLTVKAVSNAFAPEKQIASVLSESPVGLDFLKTYPNPASDFLVVTFENNNNQDIDVKLMDTALGKVMLKNTYGKRENVFMEKIDIRNINTGSYLLEVLQGEERVVKKVVKIN